MNHIETFFEITNGKLKYLLSGKLPYKDVLSLVKSVNARIVFENVPVIDTQIISKCLKYKALGYKSIKDFKLLTSPSNTPDLANIKIIPTTFYHLNDNFVMPNPPDISCKIILGLFIDEFERIKTRALYVLESSTDEKTVRLYAVKNRQFIKTCFHTHKAIFQAVFTRHPNFLYHPVVFIHYNLNFFLIRLRLFYEKLFEDFLGKGKKNETQLLAELFNVNPVLYNKQYAEASMAMINNPKITTSDTLQHGFVSNNTIASAYDTIAKEHNISANAVHQLAVLAGKVKWNGQKNILGDIIYQLTQKTGKNDMPLLEASPETLSALISLIAVDEEGQLLSKASIKTYLQPDKFEKRPKSESKGKIDLNKLFDSN